MKEHVVSVFRSQTPWWAEKFYREKRGTPMRQRECTKKANKIWKQDTVKYSEIINTWLQSTQGKLWKNYIINKQIHERPEIWAGLPKGLIWFNFFAFLHPPFLQFQSYTQTFSQCPNVMKPSLGGLHVSIILIMPDLRLHLYQSCL